MQKVFNSFYSTNSLRKLMKSELMLVLMQISSAIHLKIVKFPAKVIKLQLAKISTNLSEVASKRWNEYQFSFFFTQRGAITVLWHQKCTRRCNLLGFQLILHAFYTLYLPTSTLYYVLSNLMSVDVNFCKSGKG